MDHRRGIRLDQMHYAGLAQIKPRAWNRKLGPRARSEPEHLFIPGDHALKMSGADVDVIESEKGHRVSPFGLCLNASMA